MSQRSISVFSVFSAFSVLSIIASLCFVVAPALAATYTQPLTASFGSAYTGQATNVRVTIYDNAGTVQIAATNTPSSNAIAESTDGASAANTGTYITRATVDTAWLPIHVKWSIVGATGVTASAVLDGGRAAAIADGFSATVAGRIDAAVSTRSTYAGADTSGVTALLSRVPSTLAADIAAIPANVFSVSVDGAITMKQAQALSLSVNSGKYTATGVNTTTHLQTVTYYRQNGTSVLAVATVTYATDNKTITGRTVTFSNLP